MRYITKQKHRKTCGAIAIANIYRRFGYYLSLQEALDLCGGLRKFKNGLTIRKFERTLLSQGFEVIITRISLNEARWFATQPGYAVSVAYCFKHKNRYGAHFVTLDGNGKALNTSRRSRLNKTRWKDTKQIWGFSPFVIIIKEPGT